MFGCWYKYTIRNINTDRGHKKKKKTTIEIWNYRKQRITLGTLPDDTCRPHRAVVQHELCQDTCCCRGNFWHTSRLLRCLHGDGGAEAFQHKLVPCATIALACALLHSHCINRRIPVQERATE
ncbi:hypothetical protein O3P69_010630 [Scylla paramamosain]|uniref:Uncharacterized protein n=1 Tax=Scylla paramamosain TaxID=85552 RepID=A0AAW0THW2_SCYPA